MNTKITSDKEADDLRQLIAATEKEYEETKERNKADTQLISATEIQLVKLRSRLQKLESQNLATKPKDEETVPKSVPRGGCTNHEIHRLKIEQKQARDKAKQYQGM